MSKYTNSNGATDLEVDKVNATLLFLPNRQASQNARSFKESFPDKL